MNKEYFYNLAPLPKNRPLILEVHSAAERLHDKLIKFDVNALNISIYIKRYFGDRMRDLRASLQLYSYILAWAISPIMEKRERQVFIDFGGGSGMLGFLAKEIGIGTVIYVDNYNVACRDAQIIAEAVSCKAGYYK